MKKLSLLIFFSLLLFNVKAQNYNFSGTMSRDVLENYLSRSITMQGLMDANACYFPPCTTYTYAAPTTYDPTGYTEDIQMLKNINARFIGRAAGLWGNEWVINFGFFNKVDQMVTDINAAYSSAGLIKPVIQAAIFEIVTTNVNGIIMSNEVATSYGITARAFNYSDMTYANGTGVNQWGNGASVPDMSKLETQMWFYYMATQYIDRGIEAIHFGQVELMDDLDPNHTAWWAVLSKIRNYAASKGKRGVILCDAHTKGLYLNNTSQLLFDFHSYPLRIKEKNYYLGGNAGAAVLDYNYCGAIYGQSKGGQTFFGWNAAHLPYLVEFDNYGISGNPNNIGTPCFPWGWDEITWFGLQTENYRNKWLKYAHYRVKCLDENAFVEMPGRRGMTEAGVPWPGHLYRAAMGTTPNHYRQENTIKDIWNGVYIPSDFPTYYDWVTHNWTDENLVDPPATPEVNKNLIFVGTDKIFYIGTDSRIHGYVLYNGAWYTVSPSWAAQFNHNQNVSAQTPAAQSLVSTSDGSKLYYIGTDGFIYGFNINNIWDYTYFNMPKTQMIQQSVRAVSNLVPSGNNRLYYIGYESTTGNQRVHGFIYTNIHKHMNRHNYSIWQWVTESPSWAANGNGTPINSQSVATNSLILSPDGTKLYYNGNGFISGFNIINDWTYTYFALPQTQLVQQNVRVNSDIKCIGNTRIYYIGHELLTGNYRIHGFIFYNGQWVTTSPSWAADGNGTPINSQAVVTSKSNAASLGISPDGSRMAYIGVDGQIHGFNTIDDWNYTYFNYPTIASSVKPTSDVAVYSNNEIFYIAADYKIHSIKYQENYCGNASNNLLNPLAPRNGNLNTTLIPVQIEGSNIYPNPFNDELNIELRGSETVTVKIMDVNGKIINSLDHDPGTNLKIGESLSPGMYFIQLIYSDHTEVTKIIKQ